MNTEEDSFEILGDTCNEEDVQFDELVGVLEEFMMSCDVEARLRRLPALKAVSSDHERHTMYRRFLSSIETDLDACVKRHCRSSGGLAFADVPALLERRKDEISEEVWEFMSEGCLDYLDFVERWGQCGKHS